MSVQTVRTEARASVPAPRRAPRESAALAAIDAALAETGCILVATSATEAGCSIAFYDARSLSRAVDVIASAATRCGDDALAARARQRGAGAWKVTAEPQAWSGPDGDPHTAGQRSSTTWNLQVPQSDVVPAAAALLA
ncbi:hypothetical protein MO973_37180 [Paenibacillus sp. TRM 82003]|uniref:hypothetical protein n=1 Tax=Kineococcus sp. TRM81007 TaxID=2925831 RepID=UPI001F56D5A4|nr:hypothetical protein [Kineococcus sp. TRM81007]MCI2239852.1 hypothetical protein [Kineococcus sp. TRM81007]MCI3925844.1 hypothetical protein [Paenibacillus sp. TRM 82003]